jgi:putative holliday junction resolvase
LGRIVGIDFGKVRIGLAISDEMRIIAQPLETIKAAKDHKQTVKMIAEALSRYKNIDIIVIGNPLLLNGKEGEMSQLVRSFAKILEQEFPYPLIFWDERLTSSGVEKMLLSSEVSRKKRAELSDALAAVCILQNYLEMKKFNA